MDPNSLPDRSQVFAALADPVRRSLLERLSAGEQPVSALAEGADVSRSAVSQHLAVLRQAGLVEHRRAGRHVLYRPAPAGTEPVRAWLGRFSAVQLGRLTTPGRSVPLHISAVAVPVRDQARSRSFYEHTLGFVLVTDRTVDGWRWVSLLPPGGTCAVALVEAQHAGVWTGISLLTGDLDGLYHRWRRNGVAFDGPPSRQAWGARTAIFSDPDGNRLQLVEMPGTA